MPRFLLDLLDVDRRGLRRRDLFNLLADVLYELYANAAPGWTLTSADAISADGKVIGGNGKQGDLERAWIARLP